MLSANPAERAFLLPDVGEGLVSAEIIEWLVGPGENVRADQPAVIVETAKATVELPVPFAGQVVALHGEIGEVMSVGSPLLSLLCEEASIGIEDGQANLVGQPISVASEPIERLRPRPSRGTSAPRVPATPAVRRLARELGVSLGSISGTGLDGAVTARDVRDAGTDS